MKKRFFFYGIVFIFLKYRKLLSSKKKFQNLALLLYSSFRVIFFKSCVKFCTFINCKSYLIEAYCSIVRLEK